MHTSLRRPVVIAGVTAPNPLMNAAYLHSKTFTDAKRLIAAETGAVVVGSISVEPRQQNPGQGYWRHKDDVFSLNSYGMPNRGLSYFQKYLPQIVRLSHAKGKPVMANVVGFSPAEFAQLVTFSASAGADMVELNLSCPNVWEKGKQKRLITYHPELVRAVLMEIKSQKPTIKVSVKISPLPPDILREVANEIIKSGIVQAVTATNSYPNAAVTSGAKSSEASSMTLTGLTGRSLKPISLGVVHQLRELLPKHINIIACGGVSSAVDVRDYMDAGASAVQIATALMNDGLGVFSEILNS